MFHFVSKRHFVILGVCILIIGVMIPIVTFAKSPAQASSVPSAAPNIAAKDLKLVTVTASCSTPQTLFKSKGETDVQGRAVITSLDPSPGGVEEENLLLKETRGSFTLTVTPSTHNAVSVPFSFDPNPKGDSLTACIQLPGTDDDSDVGSNFIDHPAAVTFALTLDSSD